MTPFGIPNSPANHALSSVVNRHILADARLVGARAAMLRFIGVGTCCLLIGAGVGAGLYGYSYITDGRTSVSQLSAAMADALNNVTLKGDVTVTGSVPLDTTDATVKLDTTGSMVGLNTNGATVKLDTNGATVGTEQKIAPTDQHPDRPSARQLNPPAQPPPQPSQGKIITAFTVFKTAQFHDGHVITGWDFQNSDDPTPMHQYCYYTVKSDDNVWARFDIAREGKPLLKPRQFPADFQQALTNCVWFTDDGSPVQKHRT